jgi:TrbL/VirB6 plasmid conjugal transfer protein
VAIALAVAMVLLAHPLAGAASDVWGNVGPSPQLGDGGIAGRYPLTNYSLDQHFDAVEASLTGGVKVDGVPAMIAWFFASLIWLATSFLANLLITLFSFAFSLDLVNGSQATGGEGALAPVSRAIHTIYSDVFGAPWLVLAVAVAGIWAMWKALVQRRYSETAGALGLSLIYVVLALFFVAQPGTTIGSVSKWTNQMSGAFLSISSHGSPSSARQAKEDTANQLFDLLVFKPWVVLNFGGLEHCVRAGTGDGDSDPESVAVRPLSSNPDRDAALARRLQRGTEVTADGKVCVNNANKYAHRFLRYSLGAPEKDERDREYDALNDGDASDLPDAGRSGYRLGVADKPATDAMEQGGQFQRLLLALVLFVGELGAVLLLGSLAIGIILAQVLLLLLLAFSPVALVAAAIPGRGHDFFKGWLQKLAGYLLRKAAYSLILAILLAVNGALAAATAQLGWLMSFGLQSLFFWAVFLQRKTLADSLIGIATGPGAPGREGTLRVLGIYAGARMGSRALRPLRRAGRSGGGGAGGLFGRRGGAGSGGPRRAPLLGTSYSAPVGGGYPSIDDPVGPSKAAAAVGEGQGLPGQSPPPPAPRRPSSPAAGQTVLIRGRSHTVRSVDPDGGIHTRFTPGDGSGPTSHYWPAGTGWTSVPAAGQRVAIRGRRHTVRSVDPDGGLHTRFTPDDGSGPTSHYWPPGTDWSGTNEGAGSAGEPAAGDRDLREELRAEREANRPTPDLPDSESSRGAPSTPRRRRRWRRKGQR